ncbi:MAG: LacI family DNA-binding transcriptional regulator [Aerococcus sp.]|nr:LacI family DNA-binding transcriptional regulator [Aerococcus sp.]
MTRKKVTIKDVAQAAGVSITTVSLILNGNDQRFSDQTIQKVKTTAQSLNYQADYFAQRLTQRESSAIGIIVPDITNPFFGRVIHGVESVLFQQHFVTLLANTDADFAKEQNYLAEFVRRGTDGFIILSSAISDSDIIENLEANDRPFIVLDQKEELGEHDRVSVDDYRGGALAGDHLKALGHEKVAAVFPNSSLVNLKHRLDGFQSVYPKATVIASPLTKTGGEAATKQVVMSGATAVFAANDEIAFGLYRGFRQLGYHIPEDISIVGYDDSEMATYVTPGLTSVAQPAEELGQVAAQLLVQRLKQPTAPFQTKKLPVALIERQSTAPLLREH